jgi:hypothetical protein
MLLNICQLKTRLRYPLNLLISTLLTLLCGCSFIGTESTASGCSLPEMTRIVDIKKIEDPEENIQTVLIRIPKSDAKIEANIKCILESEYENRRESDKSKFLVIHVLDNNVVTFFELNFHLNMLVEMRFVQDVDSSNYVAVITELIPLTSVIRMLQVPGDELPVAAAEPDFKMMPKEAFLALMSELTNGHFLQKS